MFEDILKDIRNAFIALAVLVVVLAVTVIGLTIALVMK